MKKVFLLGTMVCTILYTTSCSKNNEDLIIGEWQRQSPTENELSTMTDDDDYPYGSVVFGDLKFNKNNSATMTFATTVTIPFNYHNVSCNWSLNDSQSELKMSGSEIGTMNFVVKELTEDKLAIIYSGDHNQNKYTYKKSE